MGGRTRLFVSYVGFRVDILLQFAVLFVLNSLYITLNKVTIADYDVKLKPQFAVMIVGYVL